MSSSATSANKTPRMILVGSNVAEDEVGEGQARAVAVLRFLDQMTTLH